MSINPRPPGNLALALGAAALLGLRWLPPQFSDPALSAGIILSAAGLMLRLVASDSRAKQARGGIMDAFLCGLLAAALVSAWWSTPPAPSHHNDGGDIVGLIVLPIVWFLVSGLLLLFRSGMACQPKVRVDERA